MWTALRLEWHILLLAVQFLTRVPVPGTLPWSDDLEVRAAKYYPLVGALVGGCGALVLWGASVLFSGVAALVLSLLTTLVLTGALHEDGLADSADGLVGGRTADRALEIMRDSRLGTYGALALICALALKVALLASVPVPQAAVLLVLGHALGRMGAVHVIATTTYARPSTAKFARPMATPEGYRVALATVLGLSIPAALVLGLVPLICGVLVSVLLGQALRHAAMAKLGGYTGDVLGATVVLCELGLYLGAVAWG